MQKPHAAYDQLHKLRGALLAAQVKRRLLVFTGEDSEAAGDSVPNRAVVSIHSCSGRPDYSQNKVITANPLQFGDAPRKVRAVGRRDDRNRRQTREHQLQLLRALRLAGPCRSKHGSGANK